MHPRLQTVLCILYMFFLVFGFWFVRTTTKERNVNVIQQTGEVAAPETHPVTVLLINKTKGISAETSIELLDKNSVSDLLEMARKKGFVYYEITAYVDSVKINLFNDNSKSFTEVNVYKDGQKIQNIYTQKLEDEARYVIDD